MGQNDIMPKNVIGYLFCVVALLFSAILNAIIFGDIAGLVLSLSKDATYIQD
jgi:type III secretory pathway component EscS